MTSTKPYHPLGLPKGSVRALLALSCFYTVIVLLLQDRLADVKVFWELWLANYVMLGYYFANRQNTPPPSEGPQPEEAVEQEVTPLSLPKGSVRWLIILGFVGTAGYFIYQWTTGGRSPLQHRAFFPMLSLGGFFLGRLVNAVTSNIPTKNPSSFWKLILNGKAILGLIAASTLPVTLIFGIEFPLVIQLQRFSLVYIVFYFGSR